MVHGHEMLKVPCSSVSHGYTGMTLSMYHGPLLHASLGDARGADRLPGCLPGIRPPRFLQFLAMARAFVLGVCS
jgi:hypothetical protein